MTINEHKQLLKKRIRAIKESFNYSTAFILEKELQQTIEKIKFLESIYMTGGINNRYSEEFKNAAVKEREELCRLSSACYSLKRELKKGGDKK